MSVIIEKWFDKTFEDITDKLIGEFYIITNDEGERHIDIILYWQNTPKNKYHIRGLAFNKERKIKHHFADNEVIRGWLIWRYIDQPDIQDNQGVWGDIYIAKSGHDLWHYQGYMVSFYINSSGDIGNGDDKTISDDPNDSIPPVLSSNQHEDLFPYIYMNNWPPITTAELEYNFVQYVPNPDAIFYTNIKGMTTGTVRDNVQKEAIKFIEGVNPYTKDGLPMYLSTAQQIEGKIGSFIRLLQTIRSQKVFEDTILFVCDYYKTTVRDFIDYLKGSDYLNQKNLLWETYFSLVIELGYQFKWLDDISLYLTTCNMLELLFDNLTPETASSNPHKVENKKTDLPEETEKTEASKTDKTTVQTSPRIPKSTLSPNQIKSLCYATIILPQERFPLPPYQDTAPKDTATPTPKNWVIPYAIGELQLVQQKLLRYALGDIAEVVSIMPGEKKKIVRRKLSRITQEEQNFNSNTDLQEEVDQEYNKDFNSQIMETLAQEVAKYDYSDLSATYGPPTAMDYKGSWSKTNTTETPGQKDIDSFAKKIVHHTTRKISHQVGHYRLYNSLQETEETSTSEFDNTLTNGSIYGIHYWLNKVYQAKVVNYGNRLMFSFMIDQPATLFKDLSTQLENKVYQEPVAPKDQKEFPIKSFLDIPYPKSPEDHQYAELCAAYGITDIDLPPKSQITIAATLDGIDSKLMLIPKGYQAGPTNSNTAPQKSALKPEESGKAIKKTAAITYINYKYIVMPPVTTGTVSVIIGQNEGFKLSDNPTLKTYNEDTSIPISATYNNPIKADSTTADAANPKEATLPSTVLEGSFSITIEVICTPTPYLIQEWQLKIYKKVMAAYSEERKAYYDNLDGKSNRGLQSNPLYDSQTIRYELKKACMRLLIEHMKALIGLASNKTPSTFEVNKPEFDQFLNHVFEWNEMSYALLEQVEDLLTELGPHHDHLFTAFLQATAARVIIPVRPHHNFKALFFLSTGMIWPGDDKLCPALKPTDHPEQLDLFAETKEVFDKKQSDSKTVSTWDFLVPTTLQILQKGDHLNPQK